MGTNGLKWNFENKEFFQFKYEYFNVRSYHGIRGNSKQAGMK